jgi:pimeloyl-ACP methyl ester carboxylesterase
MATFRSGGLTLAFDDIRPGGPESGTVLMVHGFATNRAENWRRLGWCAAFERKGYRAVALDLRGHGESDKPHDPAAYTREAMAGDILALLDHLDLRRVDLLGYSMGSHLSLAVAAAQGERVANLILGGVGARMVTGDPRPFSGTMTMGEAMRADDPSAITDRTLRGFRQFADNQGEDRLALAACGEGRGEGAADPDDFLRLSMPVLVATGARDEIAGDPQVLADAIPGARAVAIPACDHFSAIPHALFKAAVFDFLEGWLDE